MRRLLLMFLCVFCVDSLEDSLEFYSDPNDPTATMNKNEPKQASIMINDPSLKLILRNFLQKLNVDPAQRFYFSRMAKVSLSSYSMNVIADYLESEEDSAEIREKVRTSLHDMLEMIEDDDSYLSAWSSLIQPWITIANLAILLPAFILVLRALRPRSYIFIILFIVFITSMVTTYNKKYQEKLAERLAARENVQDACAPAGLFEQALDYVSGLVTFKKKSACLKYIENQTVSLVSEISLMSVAVDVISHAIFGFWSNFGTHGNKFIHDLFVDMPLHGLMAIGVVYITFVIVVLLLFVRVRIPFILTTEPILLPLLQGMIGGGGSSSNHMESLPSIHSAPSIAPIEHDKACQPKALPNVTERSPIRRQNLRRRTKQRKTEDHETSSSEDSQDHCRSPSHDSKRSIRAMSPM